ncbi:hypothetical protein [Ornithinimicrobium pratense]|uniref:Type II toxin-antitoxin system VapC family toxin n=1 Tax=Ornithinimicrobium pratense TaxID=2593973 RepID=A0A5J6V6Y9_9MICO|nr:hypothetical protein [Ornithinimicrobium pratense]QFG69568.1 hypothetical protein FY030_13430 [Ornithinimicrobium pratense]
MTRFAIDAPVALRLVHAGGTLTSDHQLVGPGALRSEVLALLYRQVRTGELPTTDALSLLDKVATTKMRLLADRVSRRVAWQVAADLDLWDTRLAEYVAVAKLQADVLITEDLELTRVANGHVRIAGWEELAAALS